MYNSIMQCAATGSAHDYRTGNNLYSKVERGNNFVFTLPKGAILVNGKGEVSNR